MKKLLIFSFVILYSMSSLLAQNAFDHSIWDKILKNHVTADGQVDYRNILKEQKNLQSYLHALSNNAPDFQRTDKEALAFWINAYNAFTVSLILEHYPLKSITDIDKAWDTPFIHLGEKILSLNQIEHEIIRPVFKESRIHFALVCAAKSCPKLLNEAYDPERLDEQLEQQGKAFINNPTKNRISEHEVRISKLFSWYPDDFTREGSLQEYLNNFSNTTISPDAVINYMEYNWDLNDVEE